MSEGPGNADLEKAQELKALGNKSLQQGLHAEAVEHYTRALELDPTNAIILANRAQANIKSEAYGSAISDATAAIENDPSYIKGYYRRAVAYSALLKYKEALADLKTVVAKAPHDLSAKAKLAECQKIIRAIAFAKAIESSKDFLMDTLVIKDMRVDDSYDGPQLEISYGEANSVEVNMTQGFIKEMVERFKSGKVIPRKYLYAIVLHAMRLFKQEPTMVEVKVDDNSPLITVCGDTHGQFFDVLEIFRRNGEPSEDHMYLFNGDFVDRGSWSCEIAILFYCYKILYPTKFFLNRGNHETVNMNKVYGFEGECKHKFGTEKVFELFTESFSLLPLATLIHDQYLVLHGGLFSKDDVTLDDIRAVDRFKQLQPGNEGLMMEMLWTDPQADNGRSPSIRGIGIRFGPDVTKAFCERNGLKAVIRSHEVRQGGYSEEHDGKLVTVFSAPNYCDSEGNLGAYINIERDMKLQFVTFKEVPHPNVKSMAYASSLLG